MAPPVVSMEDRFWAKVNKQGPKMPHMKTRCWQWTAAVSGGGKYGMIGMPGRNGRMVMAHRYSYELHHGPIPPDKLVLHRCDNPGCVRPTHLWLGTHLDNMQDKVAKGRHAGQLKTHCPQNHKYTKKNTAVHNGKRSCRTCARDRAKTRYRKDSA